MNARRNLILLFGQPRSGTTWIGKVFDSHPDTLYRHEPDAVYPLVDIPFLIGQEEYERYAAPLQAYSRQLHAMSHHRICGKLPLHLKSYAGPVRRQLQWLSIAGARIAAKASVYLPIYNPAKYSGDPNLSLVWKSVSGLGRLGALVHAHPAAKAVLILRHPCGYVSSQLRGTTEKRFGGGEQRLRKGLPPDLAILAERVYSFSDEDYKNMAREERITWRWLLFQDWARTQIETSPNCRVVWYDDLCRDPEAGFKALFFFSGLKWTHETERFLQQTVSSQKDHYYSIFKDPLAAASRWQEELSGEMIDRILAIARHSPAVSEWLDQQPAFPSDHS